MAAKQPFRQNLTGAQGTTLTGTHGGTQQLGAAAQRRLQSQPTQPVAQPPTAGPDVRPTMQFPTNPGTRTPPPFDPNAIHRLPMTLPPGDMMTLDGGPGRFPGGAPGIAPTDGTQSGQAGPPGMFDHTGQQLGVQDPANAGDIDNAISSLRAQLGTGTGGGSLKDPNANWMSGEMRANLGQGLAGDPRQWSGSFGASPGTVPLGAGPGGGSGGPGSPNFGKPLPASGAAGVAAQPTNPYAALLRSRLGGGGGVGGAMGGAASLRGF